ncbi:ROK family protein [Microbacterium sp. NPDC058389]|uniref:ROK family protein n=1 Tax=Microbacterium sp. NPDC058389 TaxID=3346475 RepID=UPI003655E4E8
MTEVVFAVDIGGTKTTAALADRDDVVLDTATVPTPAGEGPEAVVRAVVGLAAELAERAGGPGAIRVCGVGVATAGVVDVSAGGIVSSTDTFARWTGTPLAARLREALGDLLPPGAPIHVQNDVDAHALGEFRHGAAAGARSALVVAVGTGVGAGVVVDGVVLRGAHHVAGEIAHLPVPGAEHLRCPCGRAGHLEAIGSGVGLHRHYLALGGDPEVADARGVVARSRGGDPIARRALVESAAAVGRGIAGAVTLLDPERVVVTGGVAQIGEDWWTPMTAAFAAEVIDALQDVVIAPGELAADAPLRGAAASIWEKCEVMT